MTAVALKLQCDDVNAQLLTEVATVLEQADQRRMALTTLHLVIRRQGWGGWSYPKGWGPLCLRLGLYVYKGRTVHGKAVTWVGLDQPSEEPMDEFITRGFVVIDDAGRYFRRDPDPDRVDAFTSLRSRARVWVTFAWAVRRIKRLGGGADLQVGSTHHMQ